MQVELMLYLAWLVPSSISFLASCAVIYYILWLNPGFKDKIFHQVSLFLAGADIMQCCAWFIGSKYEANYNHCAVQEYMLQAGTIFKAVGTLFICAVAAHTISARRNPSYKERRSYIVACVTISLFFLALSMSFQSARLFCDANIDKYSAASWKMKLAMLSYFFSFAIPVYLSCLVDVAFFMFMRYRLNALLAINTSVDASTSKGNYSSDRTLSHQSGESNNSDGMARIRNSEIILVVNRLIAYPLIFFLGWLPDSIALIVILATGRDTIPARLVTNATAGSTGWAMALNYFYFEWKIRSSKSDLVPIPSRRFKKSSELETSLLHSSVAHLQHPRLAMHLGLESETIPPSEIQPDAMPWHQPPHGNEDGENSSYDSLGGSSAGDKDKTRARQTSYSLHVEALKIVQRDEYYERE